MSKKYLINNLPVKQEIITSQKSFENKKLYEYAILPKQYFPYTYNSRYNNLLFGKVDTKNNAIILSETFLKRIDFENNKNDVRVMDFVADAFVDMVNFYRRNIIVSAVKNNFSSYLNLAPLGGYDSVSEQYIQHMKRLFDVFYFQLENSPADMKKINNFESFVRAFLIFLGTTNRDIPFTRSSFITSRISYDNCSGLIINLANEDYDDDRIKLSSYIKDVNFDPFVDACTRHGFVIDKNAPWRIIADLNSPAMLTYLSRYGLKNADDVFNKRYYKAYVSDIQMLKFMFKQFYNSMVTFKPVVINDEFLDICSKLQSSGVSAINDFQLDQKYDKYFFNRMYIFLKATEHAKPWDQTEFEKVVQNANQLAKYAGDEQSLSYINNIFTVLEEAAVQLDPLTELEVSGKIDANKKERIFSSFNF